jgi:hypothetical protein
VTRHFSCRLHIILRYCEPSTDYHDLSVIVPVLDFSVPLLPLSYSLSCYSIPPKPTSTPRIPHCTHSHPILLLICRLSLSPLQLGNGTVLLVDETTLGEGNLSPTGTRSMCALRSIVSHQQLPMSYPYYELKVPTDLPLLLLTCSTGNSLSGANAALKVVLQPSTLDPSTSCPMEESKDNCVNPVYTDMPPTARPLEPRTDDSEKGLQWLRNVRAWWSTVRLIEVSMSETVAAEGVDSFAHARQRDLRLTQADFHRWLTVSRLLAVSEGAGEISSKHWAKMRDLEQRRLDRISPSST